MLVPARCRDDHQALDAMALDVYEATFSEGRFAVLHCRRNLRSTFAHVKAPSTACATPAAPGAHRRIVDGVGPRRQRRQHRIEPLRLVVMASQRRLALVAGDALGEGVVAREFDNAAERHVRRRSCSVAPSIPRATHRREKARDRLSACRCSARPAPARAGKTYFAPAIRRRPESAQDRHGLRRQGQGARRRLGLADDDDQHGRRIVEAHGGPFQRRDFARPHAEQQPEQQAPRASRRRDRARPPLSAPRPARQPRCNSGSIMSRRTRPSKSTRSRACSLAGRFNSATGDGPVNSPRPRASLKISLGDGERDVRLSSRASALAQTRRLAFDDGGEISRLKVRKQPVAQRTAQDRARLLSPCEGLGAQLAALGAAREIALGKRAEGGDLFDPLAGAASVERGIAAFLGRRSCLGEALTRVGDASTRGNGRCRCGGGSCRRCGGRGPERSCRRRCSDRPSTRRPWRPSAAPRAASDSAATSASPRRSSGAFPSSSPSSPSLVRHAGRHENRKRARITAHIHVCRRTILCKTRRDTPWRKAKGF